MKIGLVSPYKIMRPGGVLEHVRATQKILKERGYDVKLITPLPRKGEIADSHYDEDTIFLGSSSEVKLSAPFNTTFDVSATADADEIKSMFASEQFDILHVHEPWMPMLGYQLLQRSDAKNVGTIHATWPRSVINKSIEKARTPYVKSALKKIDVLTAVSEVAATNVYDVDPAYDVQIVPNGILLDEYRKPVRKLPDFDGSKKTILYLNRLEKRKGPLELLKAYRILSQEHDDLRLVMVGDGPKMKALKTYVRRYDLPNVEFLGFVDDKMKKRLFKSCDVYCSPALYGESFGIVLLEAMALGAPIVAGNNEGYSSVMKERGRLSLIDPTDYEEFARRLELMLYDKEISRLCLKWGQEYVQNYTYAKVVDKYEAIYQSLLNGGS